MSPFFHRVRLLDEFEIVARDGAQVVVEIPDGGLQAAVSEERLHVADVAGGSSMATAVVRRRSWGRCGG